MVNLTIMRLMGWSGPNAFGHMENMLKGSDEGYKRNANLDEIEEEYGDAYCSFYRVSQLLICDLYMMLTSSD
jgi:hypothetical protein